MKLAVLTAGLSVPSSSRLLADRLAAALGPVDIAFGASAKSVAHCGKTPKLSRMRGTKSSRQPGFQ